MPRTTINLDAPILKDLKRRQKLEGKPLGRLVSELLAESMAHYDARKPPSRNFQWFSKPMGARVDLADKDAVHAAIEGNESKSKGISNRGKRR